MPRTQLTKEKVTELLEKSQERALQRYYDESRQELWERRRAERAKLEEGKIKKELLVNS